MVSKGSLPGEKLEEKVRDLKEKELGGSSRSLVIDPSDGGGSLKLIHL